MGSCKHALNSDWLNAVNTAQNFLLSKRIIDSDNYPSPQLLHWTYRGRGRSLNAVLLACPEEFFLLRLGRSCARHLYGVTFVHPVSCLLAFSPAQLENLETEDDMFEAGQVFHRSSCPRL